MSTFNLFQNGESDFWALPKEERLSLLTIRILKWCYDGTWPHGTTAAEALRASAERLEALRAEAIKTVSELHALVREARKP